MADLLDGQEYRVASSRKGSFSGVLTSHCETWATFRITRGRAKAMLAYNERHEGEEVTVRRAWCSFTELPAGDA